MTFEEVCRKYKIADAERDYYISNGLLPKGELCDEQLDRACTIVLLSSAGLKKEEAVKYFIREKGSCCDEEKMRILSLLRAQMLDDIHEKQKELAKIDYILYGLKNKK